MYIEAFTSGKNPREPWRSEDVLVTHGTTLFAVIDGVTDKVGVLYDGLTPGQWAGRAIARGLRALADAGSCLDIPAQDVINFVNREIRASYRALGIEDAVGVDPNRRFAAQMAAVFTDGNSLRLLAVGDCGIRLDGGSVLTQVHPGDAIMARLRADVFASLRLSGVPEMRALEVARSYIVDGIGRFRDGDADVIGETAWRSLRERALENLPDRFPTLEAELVRRAAEHGLRGMAGRRNTPGALGYGSIDGFDVPDQHVEERLTSFDELETVELYSDGYFGTPDAYGRVEHWEQHIARIEREDPAKVKTVLSTKGSLPGGFTDDRSILIIRREAPGHARA